MSGGDRGVWGVLAAGELEGWETHHNSSALPTPIIQKEIKIIKRVTCIILIVLILSFLLNSCEYILVKEKAYYKNTDNYIKITGIIKYLNLKDNELYFSVDSEDTHTIGVTFVIKGKNFKELKAIGFFDNIALDQTITFICAPEITGDGYCPPVACVLTENGFVPEKEKGIKNIAEEHSFFS